MKIVLVEWHDAAMLSNGAYWHTPEAAESHTPVLVHSVGFLVKKTKEYVTITQSDHDGGRTGGFFCIPASWVNKITPLQ